MGAKTYRLMYGFTSGPDGDDLADLTAAHKGRVLLDAAGPVVVDNTELASGNPVEIVEATERFSLVSEGRRST